MPSEGKATAPADVKIKPTDLGYEEHVGIPTLTWQFPLIDDDAELEGHYCVFYVDSVPAGVPTQARDRQCAFPDADVLRPQPGTTVRIRCYGSLGDEYSDDYLVPGEPPPVPTPEGLAWVMEGTRPVGVSWTSPVASDYFIRAVNSAARPLSGQEPADTRSLRFNATVYAGEFVHLVATHRISNKQTTSRESLRVPQFEVSPPVSEDDMPEVTSSFYMTETLQWKGPKIETLPHGDAVAGWITDISRTHKFHTHTTCIDLGNGLYEVAIMGNLPGVPFRLTLVDVRGAGGNAKIGATKVYVK